MKQLILYENRNGIARFKQITDKTKQSRIYASYGWSEWNRTKTFTCCAPPYIMCACASAVALRVCIHIHFIYLYICVACKQSLRKHEVCYIRFVCVISTLYWSLSARARVKERDKVSKRIQTNEFYIYLYLLVYVMIV